MPQSESGSVNHGSNGTYKFDQAYGWFVLIAGGLLALLCLAGPAIVAGEPETFPSRLMVVGVLASAVLIARITPFVKCFRCPIQINNEGIFVQNAQGCAIDSLRWSELAKVTATNKMSQLVLWDSAGHRRVVVDQNIESFQRIRERIFVEYAKVFTVAPLPIEFRRSNFWTLDAIVSAGAATFMGWISLSIIRNGQPGSGVLLFCLFEILIALHFLSINPQLFGASRLFEDRIELKSIFRQRVMYKKDVVGVEIADFILPKAGRSSMVLVSALDGRKLQIQQRYGSLPDIYLTLQTWLAR